MCGGRSDLLTMKEGGKKLERLLPFWWVSWVGEWVGGCGVVGRGVTADAWGGAGFQAYAARGGIQENTHAVAQAAR